jgi:hypothetical protein
MPRSIQYSEKYNDELYEYRYGGPRPQNPSPPRTKERVSAWGYTDDNLTNQGPLIQTWRQLRVCGELQLEDFWCTLSRFAARQMQTCGLGSPATELFG